MKKTSYALVVPALVLSALLVSGCGAFRSTKDWQRAQQEAPLEIPPGLDTPSTSAALVVPDVGSGAQAAANAAGSAPVSDGFVLTDAVDVAYSRIGEQLAAGDLGSITSHDDATHTYQVAVKAGKPEGRPGLFRRMFGGNKETNQDTVGSASPAAQDGTHTVLLTINASGTGSEVRAQGDSNGVRRIVDALKSRMGSK